jgi:DNA primase large subunit
MDEDDRLMPILGHLAQSFLSNVSIESNFFGDGDDDPNSAKVTADMVDALAVKHFPACQYNLWNRLKRDHHLKHFARLQFGLFLKVRSAVHGKLSADDESIGAWFTAGRSAGILAAWF